MRDVLLWRSVSTPLTYNTAYINFHSSQDLVCSTKIKEGILCTRLYCVCIMCSFLWNLRSEVPLWDPYSIYYRPESMCGSLIAHMKRMLTACCQTFIMQMCSTKEWHNHHCSTARFSKTYSVCHVSFPQFMHWGNMSPPQPPATLNSKKERLHLASANVTNRTGTAQNYRE